MGKIWQAHLSPKVVKPIETKSMLKKAERAIQRQKSLLKSVMIESNTLRDQNVTLDELVSVQTRCLLVLELLAQTRWESTHSADHIQSLFAFGFSGRAFGDDLRTLSAFCAGSSNLLPESRKSALLNYKNLIQHQIKSEEMFTLNTQGYAWLVYQAGLQIEHMTTLIRRIAMVADRSHGLK